MNLLRNTLMQFAANEYGCGAYGQGGSFNTCSTTTTKNTDPIAQTGVPVGVAGAASLIVFIVTVILIFRTVRANKH